MKDDISAFKIDDTTSWPGEELLRIQRKYVMEFDNMVMKEVTHHFDCDLSEFKEWLNMKNRVKAGCGTNADRIRSMTDEELARYIVHLIKKGNRNAMPDYECGLNWLKDGCDRFFFDEWLKRYAVDNAACSANETSKKVQGE